MYLEGKHAEGRPRAVVLKQRVDTQSHQTVHSRQVLAPRGNVKQTMRDKDRGGEIGQKQYRLI